MTGVTTSQRDSDRGLMWRLRYTPLLDTLRGRLDGRLDMNTLIADAELPISIADLVREVARRTRLWRTERAEVAAELVAHFADGLAAGVPEDELLRSFGDSRRAARLIRRAKKRGRPWLWRAVVFSVRAIAALVLVYVLYGVYFFLGSPSPKMDYRPRINAPALAVAPEDRAWPEYREALLKLESFKEFSEPFHSEPRPGEENWNAALAYLDRNAEAIALAREAAAKPGFGYVLGYGISDEDAELWEDLDTGSWIAVVDESCLVNIRLPYLNDLRQLSKVFLLDTYRAAEAGDGRAAVANIIAILQTAEHVSETNPMISSLVSMAIVSMTGELVGDLVERWPDVLSDDHLRDLAHQLAACDEIFRVDYSGERMMFYDIVQHIYPDNGRGNGRITASGLQRLSYGTHLPQEPEYAVFDVHDAFETAVAPAVGLIMLDRRTMIERYDEVMDRFEAETQQRLWEIERWETLERLEALQRGGIQTWRHFPLAILMPALTKVHQTAELSSMRRDVALVVLALELYRREHGQWPDDLPSLTPSILPEVPSDRFDGRPLRYTMRHGRPLIYSVGTDRDDDGGHPPVAANTGYPKYADAMRWMPQEELRTRQQAEAAGRASFALPDGDWIFWPRPSDELVPYER